MAEIVIREGEQDVGLEGKCCAGSRKVKGVRVGNVEEEYKRVVCVRCFGRRRGDCDTGSEQKMRMSEMF